MVQNMKYCFPQISTKNFHFILIKQKVFEDPTNFKNAITHAPQFSFVSKKPANSYQQANI